MTITTLNASLLKTLQQVDTPTVCNAIEVAQGKRGFDNFTRGTVLAANPDQPAMVGFARTARIKANTPPTEETAVIRQRRMDYYRYMAEAPAPAVTVIEDEDASSGAVPVGAYWGEINTKVHQAFGIAGALTNGVMRDLGDMAENFPVVAGSVGPSHGFVHVIAIDIPVTIFGLTVTPGDLVHADQHGAVVVPADSIPTLEQAINKLLASEQHILGPASQPDFDFTAFEKAWSAFENSRV